MANEEILAAVKKCGKLNLEITFELDLYKRPASFTCGSKRDRKARLDEILDGPGEGGQ